MHESTEPILKRDDESSESFGAQKQGGNEQQIWNMFRHRLMTHLLPFYGIVMLGNISKVSLLTSLLLYTNHLGWTTFDDNSFYTYCLAMGLGVNIGLTPALNYCAQWWGYRRTFMAVNVLELVALCAMCVIQEPRVFLLMFPAFFALHGEMGIQGGYLVLATEDDEERSYAFALLPLTRAFSALIGPLVAGVFFWAGDKGDALLLFIGGSLVFRAALIWWGLRALKGTVDSQSYDGASSVGQHQNANPNANDAAFTQFLLGIAYCFSFLCFAFLEGVELVLFPAFMINNHGFHGMEYMSCLIGAGAIACGAPLVIIWLVRNGASDWNNVLLGIGMAIVSIVLMVAPPMPAWRLIAGYYLYTSALCFFNVAAQSLVSKLLSEKWKDLFFGYLFAMYQIGPLLGIMVCGGNVSVYFNSPTLFLLLVPLILALLTLVGLRTAGLLDPESLYWMRNALDGDAEPDEWQTVPDRDMQN